MSELSPKGTYLCSDCQEVLQVNRDYYIPHEDVVVQKSASKWIDGLLVRCYLCIKLWRKFELGALKDPKDPSRGLASFEQCKIFVRSSPQMKGERFVFSLRGPSHVTLPFFDVMQSVQRSPRLEISAELIDSMEQVIELKRDLC